MDDLKPCPFCGSDDLFPYDGEHYSSIICIDCRAEGPRVIIDSENDSCKRAKELWNKRSECVEM